MKKLKAAVGVFLGTNCHIETKLALKDFGFEVDFIDYNHTNLNDYNLVVLSGGFSYGDYVSAGRLAKCSPLISSIEKYVEQQKGFVLGICNGFQILCESGLLPVNLLLNKSGKYICRDVELELNFNNKKECISLPIGHKEGRLYYQKDKKDEILKMAFLKYKNNPNGSMDDIAGIYDKNNKIMGLMPHPERAYFHKHFGFDGKKIFEIIKEEI